MSKSPGPDYGHFDNRDKTNGSGSKELHISGKMGGGTSQASVKMDTAGRVSDNLVNDLVDRMEALSKEVSETRTNATFFSTRVGDVESKLNKLSSDHTLRSEIVTQVRQLRERDEEIRRKQSNTERTLGNYKTSLLTIVQALGTMDKQVQQLLELQQAAVAKPMTASQLRAAGVAPLPVHFHQAYVQCEPIDKQLFRDRVPPALELVTITPEGAASAPPSETLIWTLFTHTGRWVDDLRGQTKLIELLKGGQYKYLILLTLRATDSPAGLPEMNSADEKLKTVLGGAPSLAAYILFEHPKKAYDESNETQYTRDAVKHNKQSIESVIATLKNTYSDHIYAYEQQLREIERQRVAQQQAVRGAASTGTSVAQLLARASRELGQ